MNCICYNFSKGPLTRLHTSEPVTCYLRTVHGGNTNGDKKEYRVQSKGPKARKKKVLCKEGRKEEDRRERHGTKESREKELCDKVNTKKDSAKEDREKDRACFAQDPVEKTDGRAAGAAPGQCTSR